jgi:hypothetical protein
LPYIIQGLSTLAITAFIIGRYKATFDLHEKILDRHEKAIEGILTRIETMNNEIHFIKGCIFAKEKV